jgi:hypothetical protein
MLNPMRKILIPAYRKEQALELMDRIAGPEEAESGEAGGAADEDGS